MTGPHIPAERRLTRIPHSILVQIMDLMENPSLMEMKSQTESYAVFYRVLNYSESLSVGAWRSLTYGKDRVLIDTWDLEWIKNPNKFSI